MGGWGASVYGDPCRECGFVWAMAPTEVRGTVADLPVTYTTLLAGSSGGERHPELGWSVAEYVCHVADNLRIWAERLVGIATGGPPSVGGYDETALALARNYPSIPLTAALWSLGRSVEDWLEAVDRSNPSGIVLVHPERGGQTLFEVMASNVHDAVHHRWDIERSVRPGSPDR
jgi:hypothetical protein